MNEKIKASDDKSRVELLADIQKRILHKSDEWYYSDTNYLTNSMMSELRKSPLHLRNYLNKIQQPTKDYNIFGNAFHCHVLEPQHFSDRYFIVDDQEIINELVKNGSKNPRNTNDYKNWKLDFLKKNEGKQELSLEDYNDIVGMNEALLDRPEVKNLLNACEKEVIFHDELDGVKRKCKVDAVKYGDFIIDLKSTRDPVSQFQGNFYRYDYDRQAAYYASVCNIPNVLFIVVEKSFPYTVGLFNLRDETLLMGNEKFTIWMQQYKRLFIHNEIPDLTKYLYKQTL